MINRCWISCLVVVAGCASVGVTRMKVTQPKPEDCQLDVYSAESDVKRPFEVVCVLDSKTASSLFADKTVAGAIENARPDACECGADAIVIASGGAEGANFGSWGTGFALLRGIRYLADAK